MLPAWGRYFDSYVAAVVAVMILGASSARLGLNYVVLPLIICSLHPGFADWHPICTGGQKWETGSGIEPWHCDYHD